MIGLRLVPITSNSIELGVIPFNLYARDKNDRMVLFCKKGFEITPRHRQFLAKSTRIFYVSGDQLNDYHDYNFERIDKIVSSVDIPPKEKAQVVQGVGKRIVGKLLDDPRSGKAILHSGKFVNTCIEIIFNFPKVTETLLALGSSDSYALSHSLNVCTFSLLVGKKLLGSFSKDLWRIGMAGLLQDIGMARISKKIIDKPGKLSAVEMSQVKRHPEYTSEILSGHNVDESVVAACHDHHERADGSGYPRNLSGAEVHLFARILAVADVYDALTSDRPYRKAMDHLEAITEMARESNRYDGAVFKALMEIVLGNVSLVDGFIRQYQIDTEAVEQT